MERSASKTGDRRLGANSSIESGEGVCSEGMKLLGAPGQPPKVGACFIFIVVSDLLLFLSIRFVKPVASSKAPGKGVKSERIFLDTDIALIIV